MSGRQAANSEGPEVPLSAGGIAAGDARTRDAANEVSREAGEA